MEVYILDSLYRRNQVVDTFESLVWTERFSAFGDFILKLNSTLESRSRFVAGTHIAISESYRVMTVETVEDGDDSEGKRLLTLTGRSLERVNENRVARGTLGDLTTTPKWVLTGTPGFIARKIFHDICVLGILDPGDVIPMVIEGTIFPDDTIDEPTDTVTYEIDPMTVYKAIKDICDVYNLGFRLVRNFDTSQLYWDVYSGSDRTTSQTDLPAVIFSPDLDNLQKTTELTTIALYKNVAYVFSPVGHEIVYPLDVDPSVEGFERRVLLVNATDITDEDAPTASAKMIQRGKDELAKNRRFSAFDGEIGGNSAYKYGRDYNLGDLVEMRKDEGVTNNMQVTEQIFVSDKEGERSYPTLTINKFITSGSWLSWDFNQVWEELGVEEYWADQP
jgi:hypothetical protein